MRLNKSAFSLASLLNNSLRGLDIDLKIKEHTSILVWDEVVGEQVSGATQPEFVRDGKLFVLTRTPVWANELTFYKADIISRLNQRIGANVLKDIVFRAGRIPVKRPASRIKVKPEIDIEGIELSRDELERIEATVASSADDAAPELKRLLTTAAKLDKWKRMQGWTPCRKCGVLQKSSTGVCPPCSIVPGRG